MSHSHQGSNLSFRAQTTVGVHGPTNIISYDFYKTQTLIVIRSYSMRRSIFKTHTARSSRHVNVETKDVQAGVPFVRDIVSIHRWPTKVSKKLTTSVISVEFAFKR